MFLAKLKFYASLRTLYLLLFYTVVLTLSYFAAYELRFDFRVSENHARDRMETVFWIVPLKLLALFTGRQFNCILSFFRFPDALRLFASLFAVALLLAIAWLALGGAYLPPRVVIILDFLLSFMAIASVRMALRIWSEQGWQGFNNRPEMEGVVIAGAGEVGATLCAELLQKRRFGLRPVAFVDDDPMKVGHSVHGVPVVDTVKEVVTVARQFSATKIVIAFPSASARRISETATLARKAGIKVEIVPAMMDLVNGRARATQLRAVEVSDLLGREAADLSTDDIAKLIRDKVVMVTGAGGTIGGELARLIVEYDPEHLLLVDQNEFALFGLEHRMPSGTDAPKSSLIVADIKDRGRMNQLLTDHRPSIIFHAAAHKHVHFMESNPGEAIKNNFLATAQLASLAQEHAVERFILVSTDKAINPTSVMGASKRLAELAITSLQADEVGQTRFMAVRFGNVLGSSGSVVQIFRRQLAAGGPLTVTDPEATRYFMTVNEAAGLVLQCATQGVGGEIFFLNMGEPVKIIDLARQVIQLSGLEPEVDIKIEITGLKPGEKLSEELHHMDEALSETRHPLVNRLRAHEASPVPNYASLIAQFSLESINQLSANDLKRHIQSVIPEYQPHLEGEVKIKQR